MYAYIYCLGRLARYWNGLMDFWAKCGTRVCGVGDAWYLLDCYDYLSTCGANKSKQIFGGMEHLPFCFIHPRWYRFSSCFLMCQEVESKQIKRNSKITQHWKKKKIGSVIVINSAPLLVTISSYGEEWIQRRQNKLHWQPVHGFKIWHI